GRHVAFDERTSDGARVAFPPFGPRPRPGACLELGFDAALNAPGARLSLHLWTERWQEDARARAALIAEGQACGTAGGWRRHYRVQTTWEYWSGAAWRALDEVVDETRALTLSGFVRFSAPVDHAAAPDGLFYVRCRIVRGRFECPPLLLHVRFNAVGCEHAL